MKVWQALLILQCPSLIELLKEWYVHNAHHISVALYVIQHFSSFLSSLLLIQRSHRTSEVSFQRPVALEKSVILGVRALLPLPFHVQPCRPTLKWSMLHCGLAQFSLLPLFRISRKRFVTCTRTAANSLQTPSHAKSLKNFCIMSEDLSQQVHLWYV